MPIRWYFPLKTLVIFQGWIWESRWGFTVADSTFPGNGILGLECLLSWRFCIGESLRFLNVMRCQSGIAFYIPSSTCYLSLCWDWDTSSRFRSLDLFWVMGSGYPGKRLIYSSRRVVEIRVGHEYVLVSTVVSRVVEGVFSFMSFPSASQYAFCCISRSFILVKGLTLAYHTTGLMLLFWLGDSGTTLFYRPCSQDFL